MVATRFYSVRGEHFEWARIWITDDGCFSCLSDYGNFGYWWTHPGCEFRKFLCGVDAGYLIRKLQNGDRDEYDGDATFKRTKEQICRLRRERSLDQEAARHEWDLLREHSDLHDEFDLHAWYQESRLETSHDGVGVYRRPMHLQMFVKKLWPLFVEKLRAELASELAAMPILEG